MSCSIFHAHWVCIACVSLLENVPLRADDAAPARAIENPFAAHNAYPWRLYPSGRFESALAAGLKHIEVDITYDQSRNAAVVTHDGSPGGKEPELGAFLAPLWQQWGGSSESGYTLIVDFKSSSTALAQDVHEILKPNANLLSTMAKAPDGEFRPSKITVCLTGSRAGHRAYDDQLSTGDFYLAFADLGPETWQADVSGYVPSEPPRFVRFLSFPLHVFADAKGASGPAHVSLERLAETVRLANRAGYRMRVYTINPGRAADGTPDMRVWEKCVEAGVHMIATDAYHLAADWWARRRDNANAEPGGVSRVSTSAERHQRCAGPLHSGG